MAAAASASSGAVEPKYRHYRSDFGPLQTKPLHLDLEFDILEERVKVTAKTTFLHTGATPLARFQLNSKDLSVESVARLTGDSVTQLSNKPSSADFVAHVASLNGASTTKTAVRFDVDTVGHFLNVHFEPPINAGTQFTLETISVAKPTAHILEGFYYDWTPEGAPKTIITQCQQYGFQRMVPCLDFMVAKSYYTTRIIADKRYTHLISNGDLAPGYFDPATGNPTPQPADEHRVRVQYNNHTTNMASYLFFLGVGCYETFRDEVEYCDGKKFFAELLVFPGLVEKRHAETALQSLINNIMWTYVSTGPEATEHLAEQAEIYRLIPVRDALKRAQRVGGDGWSPQKEAELAFVRAELKKLISVWKKTGYAYTGAIYREISMQNSDYGGMENVGNTTILASRMVPSDLLADLGYIYMEGVKIHEYYHNINGSEVTGESPFEIWLNEAVTVHIQRQRECVLFGADFMRLKEVLYSFTPGQGPLAIDAGPNAMPIEPKGFNRTQELISAMTYSKAPEFVHMVELLISTPVFNRGLDHYHTKFKYSNATTTDWIQSMEWASGKTLMPMADGWLRRSGHPHVLYAGSYDAGKKEYRLKMTQTNIPADGVAWILPVDWSLVKGGTVLREGIFELNSAEAELIVPNLDVEPDFLSFARGWSFFGTSSNTAASSQQLARQALTDPDVVNRYFSYRAVTDGEKAKIIEALRDAHGDKLVQGSAAEHEPAPTGDLTISPAWVELHAAILFDTHLTPGARASILREGEDIHTRPDLAHRYWEISDARLALLQAVHDAHADRIRSLYDELQRNNKPGPHLPQLAERALKHHLFSLLSAGARKSILASRKCGASKTNMPQLARELLGSSFMTDQLFAFSHFLSGPASAEEKKQVLAEVRDRFRKHPDSIETYVGVVSGLDCPEGVTMVRQLLEDKEMFDINMAGHARTAVRMWASLRKRSLLTAEGRDLTRDLFLRIGRVNQMSAQPIVSALSDLAKFDRTTQGVVLEMVRQMYAGLDKVKEESLYNQLTTLLAPYKA